MSSGTYEVVKTEAPVGPGLAKLWTRGVGEVEEGALQQIRNIASMPFIHKHVAVMPDVHWGDGTSVGTVIPTKAAIIPAAVGVDIGCGMMAVRTMLKAEDLPDSLAAVRSAIEAAVPHGRTANGGDNDKGAWQWERPRIVGEAWDRIEPEFQAITAKHPKIAKASTHKHLGTLGTGNHFIELCLDEDGRVWVMLHSGSRGVGNRIGSYFIELAKKDMRRWFINLPDENLAYIPEGAEHFASYVRALGWAQDFARMNREIMMGQVMTALATSLGRSLMDTWDDRPEMIVQCHHNYVEKENHFGANVWVTRKGAVRAREGDLGIIPGAMGARSFIVRGKGNADAFMSCSHGAGRRMSRTEARRRYSVEDHAKATFGLECRKDADVIDETPMAYKDVDAVMAAQADLVDIVHTLRAVVCVKG